MPSARRPWLPALLILLSGFNFQISALSASVRINEVMASNGFTIADEDGDFEDWIELHNYGADAVDLSGWSLSDSYTDPFKWALPENTNIEALNHNTTVEGIPLGEQPVALHKWNFNTGADPAAPSFTLGGASLGIFPGPATVTELDTGGEAVPSFLALTAAAGATEIDLSAWFTDPDGDALTFGVVSSAPGVLAASVSGDTLTLLALSAGEAFLTVSADDGNHAPVEATVRALIYPQPFVLSAGNFLFEEWSPTEPANTFPAHMLFLQSEVNDPTLATPLERAYHIPLADAATPADAELPYAATTRTRINGLGADGISFINTGRGRDAGSALMSLDTRAVSGIDVSFTAGTLAVNNRVYALRLQYRTDPTDAWSDLLVGGQPVEYVRAGTAGDSVVFGPIRLPAELEEQANLQLQWRYHSVSGTGSRAQIRLDDITVTSSGAPLVPAAVAFDGLSPHLGEGAVPLFSVRVVTAEGIVVPDYVGSVTVDLTGPGGLSGTTTVAVVDGVAIFDDLVLTGAGSLTLTATADGIAATAETPVRALRLIELLLPRYIQGEQDAMGDNLNRVPFAYRMGLEGLAPGATYRYGNRIADATDSNPQSNGAGNFLLIPAQGGAYVRSTSAPRFLAGDLNTRHAELTADASGEWSGWLITEPSGNARFTPGNVVRPLLLLNDGAGGEERAFFLRTASTVAVVALAWGGTSATAAYGEAPGGAAFVTLHDHPAGSGRPLWAGSVSLTGAEVDERYAAFYDEVAGAVPGLWGGLFPNNLAGGVRRLDGYSATGGAVGGLDLTGNAPESILAVNGLTAVWLPSSEVFRFLPPGDGRWNEPNHWTRTAFPHDAGVSALIEPPLAGDRNIELSEGASATVGELIFTNGAWRNRVRGAGSFTFDGGRGTPARILVTDAGAGFAELDFDSVTLATDVLLETASVEGHPFEPEFGALRLRAAWTGAGGLIKRGPGTASLTGADKGFTGAVIIEEGVIRLTDPSSPAASSGVSVLDGGQLRLVSSGPGRVYDLGAGLTLAGSGRDAAIIPEGAQYGVLGALRLDPFSNENEALVPTPVTLAGAPGASVSIHVDGIRNLLDLQGPLDGPASLSKTGGGTLRLSGSGLAHTPISVTNGGLRVDGPYAASAVALGGDAVLSGTGAVGFLTGSGRVDLAAGEVLSALSVGGLDYAVDAGPGGASGALLRLRGSMPFIGALNPANRIDLFLSDADPEGRVYRAAFFSDAGADVAAFAANANWRVYRPDASGEVERGGQTYTLYTGPAPVLTSVAHTLAASDGPVSGTILRIAFGDVPEGFAAWVADNYPDPADQADPGISGPFADPTGQGVVNLLRYAFGLGAADTVQPSPVTGDWAAVLSLTFPRDPVKTDIAYVVEASGDLEDWSTVLYDSRMDAQPNNAGAMMRIEDTVALATAQSRFLRLRVEPR